MAKLKVPLLSLDARGRLTSLFSFAKRRGRHIIEKTPWPTDAKSTSQLFSRHMFTKCVDLWHLLSDLEKQTWESAARPLHMTGYAWYISQCLRPNPGIYLPLQGGTMAGIIDMDGYEITALKDPVNPQDADTEAARDAAIASALEDCIDSHIHGWDGSDWQKLKVESAAQHNLRVKLFDGANGIDSAAFNVNLAALRGLVTQSVVYGYADSDLTYALTALYNELDGLDNRRVVLLVQSRLYGFNGTLWDRLRTYGTGVLKVGRAEIGLSTLRRIGTGQAKASAGQLYWINLNPSAGNSAIELSDDLDGAGAVAFDHFDTNRDGHMITFDPPMEFATGIYLKTFTNMTSVIFGYK